MPTPWVEECRTHGKFHLTKEELNTNIKSGHYQEVKHVKRRKKKPYFPYLVSSHALQKMVKKCLSEKQTEGFRGEEGEGMREPAGGY